MGHIKLSWNPNTFLVSFKLETDLSVLADKAKGAIINYDTDLVVANILATRRTKVIVFSKNGSQTELEVDPSATQIDSISDLIVSHIISLDGPVPTTDLLKF